MHLATLTLEEFRCYRRLELALPPRGLVITGANGGGKTTILEAIAFLATTRSPRAGLDRELIRWESGTELSTAPYARAGGVVQAAGGETTLDIGLQLDAASGTATPMTRKSVKVNGIGRRAVDAVGTLRAVLFAPTDLQIITGSPSGRRKYVDVMLSQIDRRYIRALASYTHTLAQRNALLKRFAAEGRNPNDPALSEELAFWDETLVGAGAYLHARRVRTLAALSAHAEDAFLALTNGGHSLAVRLAASIPLPAGGANGGNDGNDDFAAFEATAARAFAAALAERRREEVRRAVSVIGPHRDDLTFEMDGNDLAAYGSRGQQRLAVLATKLAEIAVMTAESGEPPVALLDDILSELDPGHRAYVLDTVLSEDAARQVVITGADASVLDRPVLASLDHIEVTDGIVRPVA